MKEYNIFSCATPNFFPFIKTLAICLKEFKRKDCKYFYHLFLDTDESLKSIEDKLSYLNSEDFELKLYSLSQYKKKFISPNPTIHFTSYARCFACSMFPNLDRILYLDVDLFVINKGLEQYMDVDLTNYYTAAILDVTPKYKNQKEIQNTRTNNYFNAGVQLLNLKKIRDDGLNKIMQDAITGNWPSNEVQPTCHDQSLLNYLFRNNVLLVDPKFNNNFHASLIDEIEYFKTQYGKWGYTDLLKSISDAVIIHWAGVKPWWGDYFIQRISQMSVWQVNKFIFEYFIKQGLQ